MARTGDLGWVARTTDGPNPAMDLGARLVAIVAASIWIAASGPGDLSHQGHLPAVAEEFPNPDSDPARTKADALMARDLPQQEWMVGAYGGLPYTYNSNVRVQTPDKHDFVARDVEWHGEPFIDPYYYGVRIQRWFEGGYIGSMLDFTHSKTIARTAQEIKSTGTFDGAPSPESGTIGDMFKRLEFSHGHNMLILNGLVRLPGITSRLSPYVGGGAGINLPHTEVQLNDGTERTFEYQMSGPVFQGLVGLEFRLARVSYFIEYKFTYARYDVPLENRDGTKIGLFADLARQTMRWWSGEAPASGWLFTNLASHQLIGGLGVRFVSTTAAGQ